MGEADSGVGVDHSVQLPGRGLLVENTFMTLGLQAEVSQVRVHSRAPTRLQAQSLTLVRARVGVNQSMCLSHVDVPLSVSLPVSSTLSKNQRKSILW